MGYLISHMYALYEYAIMLPVSFHYSSIVVWWDRSTVLWLLALDRYQMTFHLRRARKEDLAGCVEIIEAVIPLMHAEGNYQWELGVYPQATHFAEDIDKDQFWVASSSSSASHSGEEILGCCALTEDQDEDYKKIWDITEMAIVPHRLAVHPNHSGKGIAKAFIHKAEELAKERGYKNIRIDTNAKNEGTNTLFPKLGYQFLGHLTLASKPPDMKFNAYEKLLD